MEKQLLGIFLLMSIFANAQNCNLPDLLFDNRSAAIKHDDYGNVFLVAKLLKENPEKKVLIIGWDTQNADLAIRRAEKVQAFMVDNFHIACENLQTRAKLFELKTQENKKNPKQVFEHLYRRVDFECILP